MTKTTAAVIEEEIEEVKDAPVIETPVEEVKADETPVEATPPATHLIAKARYDFKASQAKQLAARNQELEAKLREYEAGAKAPTTDAPDYAAQLAAIDKQIADARKDGNTDAAIDLIDQKADLRVKAALAAQAKPTELDPAKVTEEAIDKLRVDDLITRLEEQFAFLDPEHEAYDDAIVSEIQDLRHAFEARGYSSADSLSRAANYVLGPMMKDDEKPAAPTGGPRKTDIKKNLDAKKRMPPDLLSIATPSDKLGMQSELPAASKLTEEEFRAIPDSKRRQMRGDFFGS